MQVHGDRAFNNVISRNTIGAQVNGNSPLANNGNGVDIAFAPGTEVVGNQISGNGRNGVAIDGDPTGGSTSATIHGNKIGTNKAGNAAVANGENGIGIYGTQNTIINNLISGNTRDGILLLLGNNTVKSNKIGTNAAGSAPIANLGNGIQLSGEAVDTVIGGLVAGDGNLISGNTGAGILIDGRTNANRTTPPNLAVPVQVDTRARIYGNSIVANSGDGVKIFLGASLNSIGGTNADLTENPNAKNIITGNGLNGVTIGRDANDPAYGNRVYRNSISANGGLGIDLGSDGASANENLDGDNGPNALQNKPIIAGVVASAAGTTIYGTLNSVASSTFDIEFYDNPASDDEGGTFLGAVTVVTDGSGNSSPASFSLVVPANLTGRKITATATARTGTYPNTSEFSVAAIANEDVTGRVSIKASGFTSAGAGRFAQTLTITNTGSTTLSNLNLLLKNIISTAPVVPVTLVSAAITIGTTNVNLLISTAADGSLAIKLADSSGNPIQIAAGANIRVRLTFINRPTSYSTKLLSGIGPV